MTSIDLSKPRNSALQQFTGIAGAPAKAAQGEPGATGHRSLSPKEQRRRRAFRAIIVSDLVIICCSTIFGHILMFGGTSARFSLGATGLGEVSCVWLSVTLMLIWTTFLAVGSWSPRNTGRGADDYVVLGLATLQVFGLFAALSLLLSIDISARFLGIVLPLGLAGLMINRWLWRRASARRRRQGLDQAPLLIVGTEAAARDIATEFGKDPWAGYRIAGVCTPAGPTSTNASMSINGTTVPIVGMDQAILDAVACTGAETVALAATDHLRPVEIRRLMWELDEVGVDLMIAPGLIDVANQRLVSSPVAGMAMLEVTKPQYSRANSLLKRTFDIIFATTALLLVSPVLIAAAIAVKRSGPGPVFYRSERIGIDGTEFQMTKFRSMVTGADAQVADLIVKHSGNSLYFKLKDDPRVTRAGKFLRKYSIDELPQFFDVLRGDMSVVGPRPQVRREVDSYDDLVGRRLTVKPGLTGLWQVSGRSDLEVEDAVRLDLSYVENWSLMQDMVIIAKTVTTVLRGSGAY
ncbi:sugar transferase [Mycolicibacterium diernhoferi]|uniref:UDP-phosphate galactose phosphotransferase n=1 Tax=Mycolicibacterium diernhoferi TaxID=1801 RepID=A0A2A7NY51_9MYCO|nr:sugar transferase [Mycolicibacterium diernhoferi]PEG55154.1 UDP-phosphate galactose phosphotransferase [Mycolicibacterium diernhoferi]QYL23562.1 sugar transferase [Mycolicibacterium diernhoferi]